MPRLRSIAHILTICGALVGCGRLDFDALHDANATAPADSNIIGPLGPFGPLVIQDNVNSVAREFGTSVSADGLELYFASHRAGNMSGAIYQATRPDRSSLFGAPTLIASLDSAGSDGEPTVSNDGLSLVFQHYLPTQLVISTRPSTSSLAWAAPSPLESQAALSTFEGADFGPADLRLVVDDPSTTGLYEIVRADTSAPWGVPALLPGLGGTGSDGFPALRSDGLEIMWESTRAPPQAVYRATRSALDQPFGTPERLSFGATFDQYDVGDPDLSADGRLLVVVARAPASPTEFDVYISERSPL